MHRQGAVVADFDRFALGDRNRARNERSSDFPDFIALSDHPGAFPDGDLPGFELIVRKCGLQHERVIARAQHGENAR